MIFREKSFLIFQYLANKTRATLAVCNSYTMQRFQSYRSYKKEEFYF